ncbi:MAG: CxxxxCH/CxxCH domain-containing protein [Pseudomonadota bacterium]
MTSVATAVESPHGTSLGCVGCHTPANSPTGGFIFDMSNISGMDNLCFNCHKPELMDKSFTHQDLANPFGTTNLGTTPSVQKQTSHNWAAPTKVPAAGAESPLNSSMAALTATNNGIISCASCHGQHNGAGNNLLRFTNDSDQLCFDCHRSRNRRDVQSGTHPVNFNYTSATSSTRTNPADYRTLPVNANTANPTSAMKLPQGKVICSTCHGIHFTDSNARTVDGPAASALGQLSSSQGYLLRTDLRGGKANDINICTSCHTNKIAHNRKGQNIQCADCHAAHVDPGDGSVPNVWLVRRYMNYSGGVKLNSYRRMVLNQGTGDQSNFAGEFGVCQACHSVPPPGGAYPAEHASPNPTVCLSCHAHDSVSGSFSADCTSCHGMPPLQDTSGGPLGYAKTSQYDYSASQAYKDESKSGHLAHAANTPYSFSCYECHGGNTHGNGNFQQVFIKTDGTMAATGGALPTYNTSLGTCSSTYCHSNGAPAGSATLYKSPAWANAKGSIVGTAGECSTCHDAAPTTNAHGGHISSGFDCSICHSATANGNNSIKDIAKHVNGIKEVMFSGTATIGGSGSYVSGTRNCTNLYCHSNGNPGELAYADPLPWTSGKKYGCNGCHGTGTTNGAPDYVNTGIGQNAANSHNAHVSGESGTIVCATCHFTTASSSESGRLAASSRHLDGAVTVAFDPAKAGPNASFDPATGTCANISCHGYALAQWGGKGGCLGCHSASINSRAAITSQFNGNSHHVQGVLVSGEHCYQCHWEANSDGSINRNYHHSGTPGAPVELVIYGTGSRPTVYIAGTTAMQYTANGSRTEMAKINSHCIGCHGNSNNTTQPFGDGKTPSTYAWDSASIGTKFGDTGTTPWGKYTGTNISPKSTVTKAFSAHGNAAANKGGWDTKETWTDRLATSNVLCFDCHNSHGSSVSGITTSYTSATTNGGILKSTESGKGGYSLSYKPTAGGSAAQHNLYNPGAALCFDCHMKDTDSTTPWGYKATFGATQQIMGYWDSAYFGNNTFGDALRYAYKGALANFGGHFGASSSMIEIPAHQVGGLCTSCHDPHGISPTLGSNKGYGVPLLKGTWLTSPYKEDVATADNQAYKGLANNEGEEGPSASATLEAAYKAAITTSFHIDQNTFISGGITQTDDQFAGLCLKCHAKTALTNGSNHTWMSKDRIHESVKGWKSANSTRKHNYSCSKCHAPHNTNLPRLMVTNCLDYNHRGRVVKTTNPIISGSDGDEDGRGSGHMPGIYDGGEGGRGNWSRDSSWSDSSLSGSSKCHDDYNSRQQWNTKTPWTVATATPPTGGDTTPAPNTAPTIPVLLPESDMKCSYSCSTTLSWNPSLNGNSGAATQYLVQVSRSSSFSAIQYNSGWTSNTSYSPKVSSGYTYYWRVQARDKTKTYLISAWSAVDSFKVSRY